LPYKALKNFYILKDFFIRLYVSTDNKVFFSDFVVLIMQQVELWLCKHNITSERGSIISWYFATFSDFWFCKIVRNKNPNQCFDLDLFSTSIQKNS